MAKRPKRRGVKPVPVVASPVALPRPLPEAEPLYLNYPGNLHPSTVGQVIGMYWRPLRVMELMPRVDGKPGTRARVEELATRFNGLG